MADRRIEIVISASDDYSAAMRKFNNAVGDMDGAVAKAGGGTDKFSRQLAGLTDANDWAAGGVKKFKNILEGIAFGGTIGAVAALTDAFIGYAHEVFATQEQIDRLNTSVMNQTKAWKLLPEPIGAVSAATIALYNAELKYLQLQERGKGEGLERYVKSLEQVKRTMEENPELAGNFGNSIEQIDVKLEQARIKLEEWQRLMNLTPTTVAKVAAALTPTKSGNSATAAAEGDTPSFIMDRIRMTEEGLKADPPSLEVPVLLNWTILADSMGGDNKGGGKTVIEQMEEELKKLEFLGTPKVLGEVGAPREFSESVQLNSRMQEIQKYYEDRLALMDELGRSEVEINEVKNQQILAQEQQLSYLKMSLAQGSFAMMSNTMQNLTVLIGKEGGAAFKAMKAFAIAETTIQTYRAAMGSYAALAPIPVVGPALAIAAAASATIAGMARVKQIAATEPGSTASDTTVGPDGAANPSYSGGSPNAYPVPTRQEEKAPISVTLIVQTLDGKDVNWPRVMEENILPTMEKISGDGNRPINIRVAQV